MEPLVLRAQALNQLGAELLPDAGFSAAQSAAAALPASRMREAATALLERYQAARGTRGRPAREVIVEDLRVEGTPTAKDRRLAMKVLSRPLDV